MTQKNVNQWTEIFKALGNSYRLQIIRILHKNGKMPVSEIKGKLEISFKNTSRNLGILRGLGILKALGKQDHVFYEINPDIDKEILGIIKYFL